LKLCQGKTQQSKSSYTVSEALWTLIQEIWGPQTIHNSDVHQPKILGRVNKAYFLTSSAKQYLVWVTASLSTKQQGMLEI